MRVVERVPIEVGATKHNISFLRDKRDREGHLIGVEKLGKE
jgi:GTP cyclohydrolase II